MNVILERSELLLNERNVEKEGGWELCRDRGEKGSNLYILALMPRWHFLHPVALCDCHFDYEPHVGRLTSVVFNAPMDGGA